MSSIAITYMPYFELQASLALFIFCLTTTAACFIPERINSDTTEAEVVEDVPYLVFLMNPRVLAALLVGFVSSINLNFMGPMYVLRLEELGVTEFYAGLVFALNALAFVLYSIIAGNLANFIGRRRLLTVNVLLTCPALWLASGLDQESLVLTVFGMVFRGVMTSNVLTVLVPELISCTEDRTPATQADELEPGRGELSVQKKQKPSNITDKASALLMVEFGLGGAVAPTLGGALYDSIGW